MLRVLLHGPALEFYFRVDGEEFNVVASPQSLFVPTRTYAEVRKILLVASELRPDRYLFQDLVQRAREDPYTCPAVMATTTVIFVYAFAPVMIVQFGQLLVSPKAFVCFEADDFGGRILSSPSSACSARVSTFQEAGARTVGDVLEVFIFLYLSSVLSYYVSTKLNMRSIYNIPMEAVRIRISTPVWMDVAGTPIEPCLVKRDGLVDAFQRLLVHCSRTYRMYGEHAGLPWKKGIVDIALRGAPNKVLCKTLASTTDKISFIVDSMYSSRKRRRLEAISMPSQDEYGEEMANVEEPLIRRSILGDIPLPFGLHSIVMEYLGRPGEDLPLRTACGGLVVDSNHVETQ